MADYIERQASLDVVRNLQTYKLSEGDDMLLVDMAETQTELMLLPSADVEPVRHGKWKPYLKEGLTVKCSECGSRFDRPWNYCPHCGARMDGERK